MGRLSFGEVLLRESIPSKLQDRIFGRVLDSLLKLLWTNLLELATMFRAIMVEAAKSFHGCLFPNFLGLQTGSLNNLWRTRSGYLWPGFCEVSRPCDVEEVDRCIYRLHHCLVHRLQISTLR